VLISSETDIKWPIPFPGKAGHGVNNQVVFLEDRDGMYQISFRAALLPYVYSRVDGMFRYVTHTLSLSLFLSLYIYMHSLCLYQLFLLTPFV
jgi:hypothetical protein